MIYKVSYSTLKIYSQTSGLVLKWLEEDSAYTVFINDDHVMFETTISREVASADLTDFETNIKSVVASPYAQLDTDGARIVRPKAAKKGWSFWAVAPEITTSTLDGLLFAKDAGNTDIPGFTCKIYNSNDEEITTAGILNANLNTCVKTVLDFEPAFDYEMIGGAVRINSNPAQDLRLWIIGAPDIPAQLGGSKEFASGINLKFLAPDSSFEIDGRVSKYVTYSAVTHSGKLRLILKHPAGSTVNLQFIIHMYRL